MSKETLLKIIKVIVGLDAGNNSIKVLLEYEDHQRFYNYDNIIANPKGVNYDLDEFMTKNIANILDVEVSKENDESKTTGERFLFGNFAKKYPANRIPRVNRFKTDDDYLPRSSVVAIANSAINLLEELNEDISGGLKIEVIGVTGLPYDESKNIERRTKYIDSFTGVHEVKFNNPKYPIKNVIVDIKKMEVETEGLPALKIALELNEYIDKYNKKNGELRSLVNTVVAMVDIGNYTTDMIGVIFENMNEAYDPEVDIVYSNRNTLCTGLAQGVGSAATATIGDLKDKSSKLAQGEEIREDDVIAAYRNGSNIISGKDVCIEPYFAKHCTELGAEIGREFAKKYDTNSHRAALRKIYFCGGGSQIAFIIDGFKEVLKSKDYDIEKINFEILSAPKPVFANVTGYYFKAVGKI